MRYFNGAVVTMQQFVRLRFLCCFSSPTCVVGHQFKQVLNAHGNNKRGAYNHRNVDGLSEDQYHVYEVQHHDQDCED